MSLASTHWFNSHSPPEMVVTPATVCPVMSLVLTHWYNSHSPPGMVVTPATVLPSHGDFHCLLRAWRC
ncbi:hypothetical protein AAFF_G00167270 [Aldrovandia affinis]|uniref:Uncharacterized protein n=1 Tax=Aldrovandia affinis TaxID=143900 RepID=A0AAD7RMG9_9TELE|nr:hypothetical protein AAFF_G00167270 [Aldrovandia affinis]